MRKTLPLLLFPLLFAISCKQAKYSPEVLAEIDAIENSLFDAEMGKRFSFTERMEHYKVPGLSIAVVKDGQLHWSKGYGMANTLTQQPVDEHTLFQAASISKPIAALAALKLAEEGSVDLDEHINAYLSSWKLPEAHFTSENKPSLRRILSHTAGITVHGFPGYKQNDTFPTLDLVLNGAGNTAAIQLDTVPGSLWRYSGGGYTVLEKMIEDFTATPFEEYMDNQILHSLGMINSTYTQPLPDDLHPRASAAYNREGQIIDGLWHNYPEKAAAGLWTTPSDLALYCIEIQQILAGKNNGLLKKETVEAMLTKSLNGWGLGPSLQAEGDSLIFQHGGKNAGFTNDLVSSAYQGNAIIVMTNADNGGKLIKEIEKTISDYYGWGLKKLN